MIVISSIPGIIASVICRLIRVMSHCLFTIYLIAAQQLNKISGFPSIILCILKQ